MSHALIGAEIARAYTRTNRPINHRRERQSAAERHIRPRGEATEYLLQEGPGHPEVFHLHRAARSARSQRRRPPHRARADPAAEQRPGVRERLPRARAARAAQRTSSRYCEKSRMQAPRSTAPVRTSSTIGRACPFSAIEYLIATCTPAHAPPPEPRDGQARRTDQGDWLTCMDAAAYARPRSSAGVLDTGRNQDRTRTERVRAWRSAVVLIKPHSAKPRHRLASALKKQDGRATVPLRPR